MPKVYINKEDKQINDIQWLVIRRRKEKRITQDKMAKAIGKSRATYNRFEQDMSEISLRHLLISLDEVGLELTIKEKEVK